MTKKSQSMGGDGKQWGFVNYESPRPSKQSAVATTFVETDTNSFRELVQKLTGAPEDTKGPKLPPARNSNRGNTGMMGSDGKFSGLFKGGIELGPRNSSSFKLHERRQFLDKLEIDLVLTSPDSRIILEGNGSSTLSPTLPCPITPLGTDHPLTCSSSYYNYSSCSSSPPSSCNQFLSPTARPPKRKPELLSLFPLHSTAKPPTF